MSAPPSFFDQVPLEAVPIEAGEHENFTVNVAYIANGVNDLLDTGLETLAREFNGKSCDSGYGFGERDLGFCFSLHLEALAFMDALMEKFPKVLIYSFWYHGPNDTYRHLTW